MSGHKRVCLDGTPFQQGMRGGGVHRYAQNLLSGLIDRRMAVSVLGGAGHCPDECQQMASTLHELRVRENHRFNSIAKRINWLLEDFQDRIFAARSSSRVLFHSLYYRCPETRGPVMATFYDALMEHFPTFFTGTYCDRIREKKRQVLRRADRVICISHSALHDCVRFFGVPEERCRVVYLAASENFGGSKVVRDNSGTDAPFVLYVGQRLPHKNFGNLLAAFALPEMPADVKLRIVGGAADLEPEYAAQAQGLGIVQRLELMGRLDDFTLQKLYSKAACTVVPSWYEGFGLPVIEALAAGSLVACSKTSSLPEAGGDAAYYFDPALPESIGATLRQVLALGEVEQRTRQDMGLAQAAKFSWNRMVSETIGVYSELQ